MNDWLCSNVECVLEDGHAGACRDAANVALMCTDCGRVLNEDEQRFVELRNDRRVECASCWDRRVLQGQPPLARTSSTIPCAPPTEPAITFLDEDDVLAATGSGS